jgi:hypothetical protein
MPVKMEDGLARNFSIVAENIKSLKLESGDKGSGNERCRLHDPGQRGGRNIEKCLAVILWNNQGMTKMDRAPVEDTDGGLVLEEEFGWR